MPNYPAPTVRSPERQAKRDAEMRDTKLIGQIANRLRKMREDEGESNEDYPRTNIVIMLLAVRAGNPTLTIDFEKFLGFDDFNFTHDFYGIVRHAHVPSGKLGGHFLPRCARSAKP